jgi:superkiller protein 3
LPHLYNEILNHPNTSDELRRLTESKLLRHTQKHIFSLPLQDPWKRKLAIEVEKLVSGAVLLRVPDELAWSTFIDGKDSETIGNAVSLLGFASSNNGSEGYDFDTLRHYSILFPNEALTRLIQAYLVYLGVPLFR